MGLDNGLVIRKRDQKVSKEIAYWRKCWNVRGDILDIIDSTEEKYCYEISPNQLLQIVKILSKYNEKNETEITIIKEDKKVQEYSRIIILKWVKYSCGL